ncbi:helix-turn-helix domain-containing protein [uncultured Ruegeria sp.]|uniref:helix-turn-helix domain-containing protein n=1 Tax=uncultured Ruegeria sp. TaxID=259304 RepID=UPI00260929E3|nr:helix-turn-helix domain-containing protein [uncultured Ruegeria sp.]
METPNISKALRERGWRIASIKGTEMHLQCAKVGCLKTTKVSLAEPVELPAPCTEKHFNGYDAQTFELYLTLVGTLRDRRSALGLSQEDLTAAMGIADGYVNKLESIARVAAFPMLQLWAQTLGLSITTTPAPLPPATTRAIEARESRPYQPNQARYKHAY